MFRSKKFRKPFLQAKINRGPFARLNPNNLPTNQVHIISVIFRWIDIHFVVIFIIRMFAQGLVVAPLSCLMKTNPKMSTKSPDIFCKPEYSEATECRRRV